MNTRVENGIGFSATTLAGSLDAFVEVDLLLYSKRWSVEIVRFDGVTKSTAFAFDPPFETFAVNPVTLKPKSTCP